MRPWLARVLTGCVLLASCLATGGCASEHTVPATQFLVSVNSDLEVGTQLTRIEVKLYDVAGESTVEQRSFALTEEEPEEGEARLPFSFGIAKGRAQRFLLEVRGYGKRPGERERETVRQRVISGFQSRATLLLKIFLGSACYEQLCDADGRVEATCYAEASDAVEAGSCGPIPEQSADPVKPGDEHDWSPVTRSDAGAADAEAAEMDAAEGTDATAPEASAPDAGAFDAGLADTGPREASAPEAAVDAGPPAPVTLDVTLRDDRDDATWITINGVDEERLHYDDRANGLGLHIEVANDRQRGRTGLRFVLPIPAGASISSARLFMKRFRNTEPEYMDDWAPASATMQVQVFESTQLGVFDPAHRHAPTEHGPTPGVWATSVKGYRIGEFDEVVQSPELKQLVQHVVDKADWAPGRVVGFLLSNDTIPDTDYADFTDSSAGAGAARLRVVYVPTR